MAYSDSHWSFFSNYAHILVCLAEDPHARLRDVAERVGITERSASRLVAELDRAGILSRVKDGRRNRYVIDTGQHLRHPLESHCTVGEMLAFILSSEKVRELDRQRRNPELLAQGQR
ncbi:MAG: winged helix-turn-helix domain-containing protein [Gammaproteobacteria bacterium]|jgi:DNA-binding MarR family transcriptional regulator